MLAHQSHPNKLVNDFNDFQYNQILRILKQLLHKRQNPQVDLFHSDSLTHPSQRLNHLNLDLALLKIIETTDALLDQVITLLDAEDLAELDETVQQRDHNCS